MSRQQFRIEDLKKFDFGIVATAFNKQVERVVSDCMDRPTDDKAREVMLVLKAKPLAVVSGSSVDCEAVDVEFEIRSRVPTLRSKIVRMEPKADGRLLFNPDNSDDPISPTAFNDQEDEDDQNERKDLR